MRDKKKGLIILISLASQGNRSWFHVTVELTVFWFTVFSGSWKRIKASQCWFIAEHCMFNMTIKWEFFFCGSYVFGVVSEAIGCKVTRVNFRTLENFCFEDLKAKPKGNWYCNDSFDIGGWNFQQCWKALYCDMLEFHSHADDVYQGLSSGIGTGERGLRLQLFRGLIKWELIWYSLLETYQVGEKAVLTSIMH